MKKLFTLFVCLLFVAGTYAATETRYYDFHYEHYPWGYDYGISGKVTINYTSGWAPYYLTEAEMDFSDYSGWEIVFSDVSADYSWEWGNYDIDVLVYYSDGEVDENGDKPSDSTHIAVPGTFSGTFDSTKGTTGYLAVRSIVAVAYCTIESAYLIRNDGTRERMIHRLGVSEWGYELTAHEVGALTFTAAYGGSYLVDRETGETATFTYGENKIMRLVFTFSEPLEKAMCLSLNHEDGSSNYPWPHALAGATVYTYDISDSNVTSDVTQINVYGEATDADEFPWTVYFETITAEIIDADNPTEDITVSAAGYATFFSEFAYTMPQGLTGYTVTEVENGVATLTTAYLPGTIVPAETPLLIEGAAGTYSAALSVNNSSTAPTDNMLYGSIDNCTTSVYTSEGDVTEGYYFYMLSYDSNNENLGFYWGAAGGEPFVSESHKAWLAVPTTKAHNGISLKKGDNDYTGISTIETEHRPSGIYTLQGVRTSDMSQKGVYIVDGKKVLVK